MSKKCLVIGEPSERSQQIIDKLAEAGYEVVREGVDGLYKGLSFDFVVVDELSIDKSLLWKMEEIQ